MPSAAPNTARASQGQELQNHFLQEGADWAGAVWGPHGWGRGLVLLKIFPTAEGAVNSLLMKSVGGSNFGELVDPCPRRGHWENTSGKHKAP